MNDDWLDEVWEFLAIMYTPWRVLIVLAIVSIILALVV